jgi:hypothetical protein
MYADMVVVPWIVVGRLIPCARGTALAMKLPSERGSDSRTIALEGSTLPATASTRRWSPGLLRSVTRFEASRSNCNSEGQA